MPEMPQVVRGFGVTFLTMFKKVVTEQYPEQKVPTKPRFHGRHQLNRWADGLEKCVGCELCAWACPADAIFVEGADNTEHRALLARGALRPRLPDQLPALHLLRPVHRGLPDPGAHDDERVRAGRRQPGGPDLREEGPAGPAPAGHGRAAARHGPGHDRARLLREHGEGRLPEQVTTQSPSRQRRRSPHDRRRHQHRRAGRVLGLRDPRRRRRPGHGPLAQGGAQRPVDRPDHDQPRGPLHRELRALPRHGAGHRLHRRRDDALPVRPHGRRSRLVRLADRDDQGAAPRIDPADPGTGHPPGLGSRQRTGASPPRWAWMRRTRRTAATSRASRT